MLLQTNPMFRKLFWVNKSLNYYDMFIYHISYTMCPLLIPVNLGITIVVHVHILNLQEIQWETTPFQKYLSLFSLSFSFIPDENLCFWTSVKIHAFKFYKFIKLAASNKYPLYRIHIFVSNLLFLIADKSCIGHSASFFQKVYTVSSNNYLTRHKTWFFYGKYWYLDRCIKIKL